VLTFLEIQLRGRWSGSKITLRYIQESQAMLLQLVFPETVRAKVRHLKGMLLAGVPFISFGQS
jgi:hypothetical protein